MTAIGTYVLAHTVSDAKSLHGVVSQNNVDGTITIIDLDKNHQTCEGQAVQVCHDQNMLGTNTAVQLREIRQNLGLTTI